MTYYHVRVSIDGERHDEVKTDISDGVLEGQLLSPYRTAQPITINGRSIPSTSIQRIRISTSEVPVSEIIERVKVNAHAPPRPLSWADRATHGGRRPKLTT